MWLLSSLCGQQNEKLIMFALGQGEYNVRLNFPKDVDHKLVDGAINLEKKYQSIKSFFQMFPKQFLKTKIKKVNDGLKHGKDI